MDSVQFTRIASMRAVQDRKGRQDLNYSPASAKPHRHLVVFGWKEAFQPSVHVLERLPDDYHGAGTVPEAAISPEVIRVFDEGNFPGRICWLQRRQRPILPR